MRILHIITGLGRGGAETMLAKLSLGGGRHEHEVVSLGEIGPIGGQLASEGVSVHALRMGGVAGGIAALPRLVRLVRASRPQIVQGWMNHGNLAATAAHAMAGDGAPALVWNIRQSLSAPGCDGWLTNRIIRANARLSHRPARILYNSVAGAVDHEAIGYRSEKRRIIPNGFDIDRFLPSPAARATTRRALGVADEDVLIGLVARVDPWKNHAGFLAAAAELRREGRAPRFLLAGKGASSDNRDLLDLVARHGLKDHVLLLGERTDVPALTAALDIACIVSHGEGFPNALGEAMACGVPCVVTDVGDCRAIVGDAGIVCASGSAVDIAAAMARLVDAGGEKRAELGRQARARIERHYSLQAVVAQYDALYEEVAQNG